MMEKTMLSRAFKSIRNIKIKKSIQMFHLRAAEPLMTTQSQVLHSLFLPCVYV